MATKRDICEAAYREHLRFKSHRPDVLYFIRLGDFYETYDDDAELVARRLGLAVTHREPPAPAALAGLPYTRANEQLRALVRAGYKVWLNETLQLQMV